MQEHHCGSTSLTRHTHVFLLPLWVPPPLFPFLSFPFLSFPKSCMRMYDVPYMRLLLQLERAATTQLVQSHHRVLGPGPPQLNPHVPTAPKSKATATTLLCTT